MRALALAFLLAALPCAGWAQEEEGLAPAGPIVTEIEIRSEVRPEDPDELARLLSLAVGLPLSDEAVGSTIRNLLASGLASSVEVYTRPDGSGEGGGGVVAIVVLRPVVRVREVRLEGNLGLDRNELRRVLTQNEAEPLSEESVLHGWFAMEDLYVEHGYFRPVIGTRVDTDEESLQATVIYDVQSGPRAQVEEIRFEGDLGPFKPAELLEPLDHKPGEPFSRPGVRDDAEDLERWLIGEGYRSARVGAPAEEILPESLGVRLVYPITVGPKVEVQVIGADLDSLRRRNLLPFLGREGYDEALVLQAVERIKSEYQRDGHYKVQVDWEEQEPSADLLRVILRIEPGPQYTLQEVRFSGNETFGQEALEELVATTGRSLLTRGSGRLVDAVLEEDLRNVRRYYQVQGFAQAEVGPPQIEERGNDLFLTIPVQEGPQMRLVNLAVQGNASLPEDAVRNALQIKEGGPFHPLLLERSLNNLRAAYQDRGYSAAQVSAREDWNPDRTRVDVAIDVLEGPQTVLDRVIVRGNRRTESEVVRRTLGVEEGDPISESRALEIERDLYRLGIFSSVDVEVTRTGLEG
ncbi:MAG TPA: POTRA domain-containing protein, partial [Thermoanaerobaculia bacterium]|nr:POTRA domain-containing protein [Thermoanaerobaculia bacterium]